jgi:hypothetical protein
MNLILLTCPSIKIDCLIKIGYVVTILGRTLARKNAVEKCKRSGSQGPSPENTPNTGERWLKSKRLDEHYGRR